MRTTGPQFDLRSLKFVLVGAALVVVCTLALVFKPFTIVRAGHRGVVFNIYHGVEVNRTLSEGFHFIVPFVETVKAMSIRVQKARFQASASSRDLQQVVTEIVVNYHLDPANVAKVYQEIGEDYESKLIEPSIQESIKAVTAEYNATELIAKRPIVKQKAEDIVTKRLVKYHIIVDDVSITNFQFSSEFERAIEAKQVAEQQALQKNYELQKAKKDAEIAVTKAKGEKEAIIARAEGQAEMQRLLRQTLTPELIELKRIEKWDGRLPLVTGGSIPMLDLGALTHKGKGAVGKTKGVK